MLLEVIVGNVLKGCSEHLLSLVADDHVYLTVEPVGVRDGQDMLLAVDALVII